MTEDKQNRFDRYVRSLVRDAEEKVPSGVWEALSERIPTSRKPRRGWVWWPVAAAVACMCAVVLLLHPDAGYRQDENVIRLLQTDGAQREIVIAQLEGPRVISAGREMFAPVEEQTPSVPDADVQETPRQTAGQGQSRKEPGRVQSWDEELMLQEESPAQVSRPMEITVGGLLGANDSGLYGFASMPSYADVPRAGAINEESVPIYGIPVSFALGVRIPFGRRLSIGTGLSYTLLSRTFKGSYKTEHGDITHRLQYIGIPLNLNFTFFEAKRFSAYAVAGIEAEKGITNRYWFYEKSSSPVHTEQVKGIQMSAGLGIGIQYRITPVLGIYLDPGFRYYFDCNQPESIRTDKPLMFNMEAGLRFDL